MLSQLFIAALWSPGGKGLVCDVYHVIATFPFGILGQVWYLIVSILDPCCLPQFSSEIKTNFFEKFFQECRQSVK